jgi:hypothetical protein
MAGPERRSSCEMLGVWEHREGVDKYFKGAIQEDKERRTHLPGDFCGWASLELRSREIPKCLSHAQLEFVAASSLRVIVAPERVTSSRFSAQKGVVWMREWLSGDQDLGVPACSERERERGHSLDDLARDLSCGRRCGCSAPPSSAP